MTADPLTVLTEFLADAFDPDKITEVTERLVADDATYVSLTFDPDPGLHEIMPWAGTNHGKSAFVDNFRGVSTQWRLEDFTPLDTLVDGDKVALFGRFTLRSVTLDKAVTSPCAVLAKVSDGKIRYFQYMEDTFATALTFRSSGTWTIDAVPGADTFEV
ncbi:hypothetical protein ASE48_10495 [Mycobacterium sp. Root265]|uniref:nuclear transport factor 2 family protein n=1 Tax=Mycobacterium sp. Root265 TaxID=1736504 RepID=UPI000708EF10|nr:nuclear transport factor 2 family protein [Mycobacterium sp. Root265]KRD07846.1 hypothetical protein ASE48_10495 [Mycobacterium sp. Root265]